MNFRKNKTKYNRGAAALLTIVIIGAASLLMAIGSSRLGLGELETGFVEIRGASVFTTTQGCLEEAIHRLRKNNTYTGQTLSVGAGSCIISVSGSGSTRTITSTATIDSYTRKLEIIVDISNPVISISSWSEIAP